MAATDPLAAAMRATGGRRLLSRVKALSWEGSARVVAGDTILDLGIETRVEPFVRARSTSWVATKGRATARTLMIEPDRGIVERDGKTTPLPVAQERHERQQYGLYGYLLLALAPVAVVGGKLQSVRDGLPPVRFDVAGDGHLTGADYTVGAPDAGDPIRERFTFTGQVRDKGVSWPRQIDIAQDGTPFFTLKIERFRVELR